jgi:Domain of unknown function (DUF4399)
MRMFAVAAALVLAASVANVQAQERTPSPKGAKVFIVSPKNGETVSSPVTVKFGIKGMTLAPAGTKAENTGHHHLLIDTDPPADLGQPLPTVPDKIIHFGKAQTETTVTLPPGKHTLQLLLGDANHIPHNPPVISKKITITVK